MSSEIQKLLLETLGWDPSLVSVRSLSSGFTNEGYCVLYAGTEYFVRRNATNPTKRAISREQEERCLKHASSIGVSPRVILCTPELLVLAFKVGIHLSPDSTPDDLVPICSCLRRLHDLSSCHSGEHPVESTKRFLNLKEVQAVLDDRLVPVTRILDSIQRDYSPQSYALCHMDPNPWNILVSDTGIYLLDWEYASYSDPIFDVAMLAIHHSHSLCDTKELLERYDSKATVNIEPYWQLASIRRGLWNAMHYSHSGDDRNLRAVNRWIDPFLGSV